MLDSTFAIDFLRGDPDAAERMTQLYEEGQALFINEIVVCELRAGMRENDVPDLVRLIEPLKFVQPGADAALRAGQWRAEARSRGSHLSLANALIAAAAEAAGAAVLTRNVRDFRLTPVRVETY